MGSHHVDVDELVETVRSRLRAEVGRLWLEPHPGKQGWTMAGWELAGRLEWYDGRPAGDPYDVVVDGRTFSWDELGRFLEPFEGMRIRVLVEEVIADERPPNDAPPALSLPPMVTGPEAGGDATGVEPVEP
jgi:hypothetical protein